MSYVGHGKFFTIIYTRDASFTLGHYKVVHDIVGQQANICGFKVVQVFGMGWKKNQIKSWVNVIQCWCVSQTSSWSLPLYKV